MIQKKKKRDVKDAFQRTFVSLKTGEERSFPPSVSFSLFTLFSIKPENYTFNHSH